jgi:hypothetical protein
MRTAIWLGLLVQAYQVYASAQAAALLASAHQLPAGNYHIKNVGNGKLLTGDRNNLYAGSGTPVEVTVVPHTSGARHSVFGVGPVSVFA